MRRPLALGFCVLLLLATAAFAQTNGPYVPLAGGAAAPQPATQTNVVYYAFKTLDNKDGIWGITPAANEAPDATRARALTSAQQYYSNPGISLISNTPLSQQMADFKKANPASVLSVVDNTPVVTLGDLRVRGNVVEIRDPADPTKYGTWAGGSAGFTYQRVNNQDRLLYNGKPVRFSATTNRLIILNPDGTGSQSYYETAAGGVHFYDAAAGGTHTVSSGTASYTFSKAQWDAQFGPLGAEQLPNIVVAGQRLAANGADVTQATFVRGVGGQGNFVYKSFLGSDVMVSGDGKVVTRGTLLTDAQGKPTDKIDPTKSFTTNSYNAQTGSLATRLVFAPGQNALFYNYGSGAGSQWQYQEGTVGSDGAFASSRTVAEGKVLARTDEPGELLLGVGTVNGEDCGCGTDGTFMTVSGRQLTADELKTLNQDTVKAAEKAQEERRKAEPGVWAQLFTRGNIGAILSQIASGYEQFRGIGAYGSLFIGKDDLAARRARINERFCKIGLGIECLSAKLCERYTDEESGDNTIITVYPGQAVRAAAHIQAERTEAASYANQSGSYVAYLYRVTYYASSAESDNHVQLTFLYDGGSYDWYPEPGQAIVKGGVASAQGNAALVKYSNRYYTTVCLQLEHGIDTGTGGSESRLCVPIVDSGITATGGAAPEETAETGGTGAPGSSPGAGF